jgi:hypothetical protein
MPHPHDSTYACQRPSRKRTFVSLTARHMHAYIRISTCAPTYCYNTHARSALRETQARTPMLQALSRWVRNRKRIRRAALLNTCLFTHIKRFAFELAGQKRERSKFPVQNKPFRNFLNIISNVSERKNRFAPKIFRPTQTQSALHVIRGESEYGARHFWIHAYSHRYMWLGVVLPQ